MKRINFVKIAKISRCCFISYIDRMFQRKTPYWESFEFSVSCHYSTLMVMVNLSKTCCHFPAAGSWGSDYHYRFFCFYIFVGSIAIFADNGVDLCRITLYCTVSIYFYLSSFEPVNKALDNWLILITGNNNSSDT